MSHAARYMDHPVLLDLRRHRSRNFCAPLGDVVEGDPVPIHHEDIIHVLRTP